MKNTYAVFVVILGIAFVVINLGNIGNAIRMLIATIILAFLIYLIVQNFLPGEKL